MLAYWTVLFYFFWFSCLSQLLVLLQDLPKVQISTWDFLIVFHCQKDKTVSMTYNFFCILVPTSLSNLTFFLESFSSLHLTITSQPNLCKFFVVLRTSHAVLPLYLLPARSLCLTTLPNCQDGIENVQFGEIIFSSR